MPSPDLGFKNTMQDEAGGYLVPEPLASTMFMNIANKSAIIPFLQPIPMTSATLRMNALADDVTMTWVDGEGGAKTVSNETHRQIVLTAYELAVIVLASDILIEDANIAMDALIRKEIETALIQALEQSYLGYFAATPFAQTISGDCPLANTITLGDNVDFVADCSQALNRLEDNGFTDNIGFVTHPTVKARFRDLRDDDGRPIFEPGNAKEPGTLFGYPIRFTRNMVDQGSPTGHELIVADWEYLFEGVRNELRLAKSNVAVVGEHNTFTENKTAIKAWIRRGFAIRDENAIAKVIGL